MARTDLAILCSTPSPSVHQYKFYINGIARKYGLSKDGTQWAPDGLTHCKLSFQSQLGGSSKLPWILDITEIQSENKKVCSREAKS